MLNPSFSISFSTPDTRPGVVLYTFLVITQKHHVKISTSVFFLCIAMLINNGYTTLSFREHSSTSKCIAIAHSKIAGFIVQFLR